MSMLGPILPHRDKFFIIVFPISIDRAEPPARLGVACVGRSRPSPGVRQRTDRQRRLCATSLCSALLQLQPFRSIGKPDQRGHAPGPAVAAKRVEPFALRDRACPATAHLGQTEPGQP